MTYQIGIAEQYARRVFVGAKDGYGFSGLYQQRFIRGKILQRANDGMKTLPIPRRFSCAAVYHQIVRFFSDLRIEIIHEHAQRGFLMPALAGDFGSARRFEWAFARVGQYRGFGRNWGHNRSTPILSQRESICTKPSCYLKCTLLFIEALPQAAIAPR